MFKMIKGLKLVLCCFVMVPLAGLAATMADVSKAALAGNAKAQYMMALAHQTGKSGIKVDLVESMIWMERAATQGMSSAQFALAEAYEKGTGVEADENEAFRWMEAAAKQGMVGAQLAVGIMYFDGRGVVRNHEKAAEYIEKAAIAGNPEAQYRYGTHAFLGIGIERDLFIGKDWIKKAAEQGVKEAQYDLGTIFEDARLYTAALGWYAKAMVQGHASAGYNAGVIRTMNIEAKPELRSLDKALDAFRGAANLGHPGAMNNLGVLLMDNADDEAKVEEGLGWLLKSAEAGYKNAQFNLGKVYLSGKVTPVDKTEAYYWLSAASLNGHDKSSALLDVIADELSVDELLEAQKLIRDRKKK